MKTPNVFLLDIWPGSGYVKEPGALIIPKFDTFPFRVIFFNKVRIWYSKVSALYATGITSVRLPNVIRTPKYACFTSAEPLSTFSSGYDLTPASFAFLRSDSEVSGS